MNTEQMKAEYEANPDKWVVYWRFPKSDSEAAIKWSNIKDDHWSFKAAIRKDKAEFKLILKEHEHIADAVIADSEVGVEYLNDCDTSGYEDWLIVENFFNDYEELKKYQYCEFRLTPTQINSMEDLNDLPIVETKPTVQGEDVDDTDVVNIAETISITAEEKYSNLVDKYVDLVDRYSDITDKYIELSSRSK